MIIKFGRMGKFLACPEPGVKVTLPMPEEAAQIKALEEKTKDERCPICGKPMKVTPRTLRLLPRLRGLSEVQRRREDLEQDRIQMPEVFAHRQTGATSPATSSRKNPAAAASRSLPARATPTARS